MDMPSSDARLLTIGEFSRLSRISVRMLRHYDEHGVLHPTRTDPWSGYRYYAVDLLRPAAAIRELRDVGLKVAELAACVPLLDEPAALQVVLKEQRGALDAEADAVADRIRKVDHLIHTLEERMMSTLPNIEITRRELPARTVASLRDVIPDYRSEGILWERLMSGMARAAAVPADGAMSVAVFHDDDVVDENPDVEVQADVAAPFESNDDARCVEVPPVSFVAGRLFGSYDGIPTVTEALGRWVTENDEQIVGPMFSIYVVSPAESPDPAAWVTDLCLPVAPA